VTVRVTLVIAALLALLVGCTSDEEPELPSHTDVSAIADRVTGPDGQNFLRQIVSASWDDGGRRAGELFGWIPRDAGSTDQVTATRAGQTAHAIASFLADERDISAGTPANPALWQAFAQSMVPYLGAAVGDESGVSAFAPLDGLDSQMRRTAALFAAMTKEPDANRIFTAAASDRAHTYEAAFAKAAVAEPLSADRGDAQRDLLRAARLRGLVAAGAYIADPESEKPTAAHAQTELAYQVASLSARPDDPHINPEFFKGERLLPPSQIADVDWSIYDSQLTVFLAASPQILEAIQQFGRVYGLIAIAQ
jgi:hypothetical protein